MDLLTKIAFVALVLDVIILVVGVPIIIYYINAESNYDLDDNQIRELLASGEIEELKQQCNKLLNSTNKTHQHLAYVGMARIEFREKNIDKAEENLLKAVELKPKGAHAYIALVDIMFFKKEIFKAFYYLFSALTKCNTWDDFQLYIAAAKLFTYIKHYDEAIAMFEKASGQNSWSPLPLIGIAIVHYLNKNNTKAIDFIRQARTKTNSSVALDSEVDEWAKGLLAIMSGDIKEAKYIFEYYSETNTFGPIFELILERINLTFDPDR